MLLTIKPLMPDLYADYLNFFDNRAFSAEDSNGPCYCTCPTQTTDEIDRMVAEFAGDVKGVLRQHAVQMLEAGKLHGYLAYADGADDADAADGAVVGWCNAGDMDNYLRNRYQFIPDFAWDKTIGKTMSVVCFAIAPAHRGKGVSTALLGRVVEDARVQGFTAVEGYVHLQKGEYDMDFKGPVKLYEKMGFVSVVERDGVALMRKRLVGAGSG